MPESIRQTLKQKAWAPSSASHPSRAPPPYPKFLSPVAGSLCHTDLPPASGLPRNSPLDPLGNPRPPRNRVCQVLLSKTKFPSRLGSPVSP